MYNNEERISLNVLDCAHFDPGLASIVYGSVCVGSTSYFVVHAEVASQGENRQGAGIREGADQRYFTVYCFHSHFSSFSLGTSSYY